ncbi:MAG TPA: hypothetical protein HA367_08285 [Candidatus Methanofastidiosum sp.]|jgi:hypothetical protein|nr:hypothetical protein [Methanofastidiosum sp.]
MAIKIPPPITETGAPAHTSQHVKFFLTMDGKPTYFGYFTDMTFTPEKEFAQYKPAGAGAEYDIKGIVRVTGTLNRGHINADILKDFVDSMYTHCEIEPTYTITTETCFPDGQQKRVTIVILGVTIPSLTITYPMADLSTESIPFKARHMKIFDGAKSI